MIIGKELFVMKINKSLHKCTRLFGLTAEMSNYQVSVNAMNIKSKPVPANVTHSLHQNHVQIAGGGTLYFE